MLKQRHLFLIKLTIYSIGLLTVYESKALAVSGEMNTRIPTIGIYILLVNQVVKMIYGEMAARSQQVSHEVVRLLTLIILVRKNSNTLSWQEYLIFMHEIDISRSSMQSRTTKKLIDQSAARIRVELMIKTMRRVILKLTPYSTGVVHMWNCSNRFTYLTSSHTASPYFLPISSSSARLTKPY